jgi:hypothetical protein
MRQTNRQPANGNGGGEEQREERVFVRVSVREKRKFQRLAKSRHTDISELARQLLHREADSKAEA